MSVKAPFASANDHSSSNKAFTLLVKRKMKQFYWRDLTQWACAWKKSWNTFNFSSKRVHDVIFSQSKNHWSQSSDLSARKWRPASRLNLNFNPSRVSSFPKDLFKILNEENDKNSKHVYPRNHLASLDHLQRKAQTMFHVNLLYRWNFIWCLLFGVIWPY